MLKLVTFAFALALASVHSSGTAGKLGGGSVEAWVVTDAHGAATEFGVTCDESALSRLSDDESETVLELPLNLELPFRSVVIDWHPHGHPPAHVYDVPHFDFHFYTIDEWQRMNIAPVGPDALATPSPDVVPAGFITDGSTVPMMGKHFFSRQLPEFTGGTFTASPIYGYYGGHLTFVEAMITRSYLQTGANLFEPLAQPLRFERHGRYPTQWGVTHDRRKHRISIYFSGLMQR